jgi:alkylhydroperoxidase family enzyme
LSWFEPKNVCCISQPRGFVVLHPPDVAETLSAFVLPPWTGPQNILATLANHGPLFGGFAAFAGALYGETASLPPAEREFAYLTASQVNECFY